MTNGQLLAKVATNFYNSSTTAKNDYVTSVQAHPLDVFHDDGPENREGLRCMGLAARRFLWCLMAISATAARLLR